jgi:hypothetical protein
MSGKPDPFAFVLSFSGRKRAVGGATTSTLNLTQTAIGGQATSVVCRTGTPLIAGEEERTREVFGDYVSIYDFAQSVADGATAPLYYESRLPELHF